MEIIHHKVNIYRRPAKYSFQKDEFKIETLKVVAQNSRFIILDTPFFCKIQKPTRDKFTGYAVIEKESISFNTCLNEQGIFYTLYSETTRRASTIKKHIQREAEKKYGWLFSKELDLSILDGKGGKNG